MKRSDYLNRNVILISLSAFFADMGYQAVTAVFALILVLEMHEPAILYGLLLGLSYGLGSVFSLIGGRLGETHGKKRMALLGNLLIPLMSISVLFSNILIIGALFVLGWWARYFRSPVRRAWLAEVSDPKYSSRVFGFLHALDVGGGMIAVIYSIVLVILHVQLRDIILVTIAPLLISSLCLGLAGTEKHAQFSRLSRVEENGYQKETIQDSIVFRAVILSATFFGFSYYALGFPIITVAETHNSFVYGILTFGIYLGISALAGYSLGYLRAKKPLRTLWSIGYLLAALSSLTIGLSYMMHSGLALFYLGAAGLGFATGSVETFEPVMIAAVAKAKKLSTRMGWLSSSRALGLFVSNVVMGTIFIFSEFYSYLYASLASLCAAAILIAAEVRIRRKRVREPDQSDR